MLQLLRQNQAFFIVNGKSSIYVSAPLPRDNILLKISYNFFDSDHLVFQICFYKVCSYIWKVMCSLSRFVVILQSEYFTLALFLFVLVHLLKKHLIC